MKKLTTSDSSGNERMVGPATVKGELQGQDKNLMDYYTETLADKLSKLANKNSEKKNIVMSPDFPKGFKPFNNIWRYEPVDSKYFFKKMIGESLTDCQQKEAADIICSSDPFKFTNLNYREVDLFWGKRGGKDATIAKILTYQAYRLCCLIDPQKFLGMGVGSSIDVINVSKTGQQALNVFFKYLKTYTKGVLDPNTNMNWFIKNNFWYDVGVGKFVYQNLREGESVKKQSIEYGRGITAHSGNSNTYTGEGLNLVLAVIDEVGSMRHEDILGGTGGKIGLYDSLKTTLNATSKFSKMVCVSYKYGRNCAMSVMCKKNEKFDDIYVSKKSTFEVRPDFDRGILAKDYIKDPNKCKMMYEIADIEIDIDSFYDLPYVLDAAQDVRGKYTTNPFIDKSVVIDDIREAGSKLDPRFKGKPGMPYVAHIDLAKGQVWKGKDAIGLAVAHPEDMRISLDGKTKKYLMEVQRVEGIDDIEGELRSGIVIDLACHIVCKPDAGEVMFSDVRRFLIDLKIHRGFNFVKVTLDGWQSTEFIQQLNAYGIDASELSVDKNIKAYQTEKDLIMMGLYKIYPNRIWLREKKELIEVKNKIDHPDLSNQRMEDDNIVEGSKDLSDCTAGVSLTIVEEVQSYSNPVF